MKFYEFTTLEGNKTSINLDLVESIFPINPPDRPKAKIVVYLQSGDRYYFVNEYESLWFLKPQKPYFVEDKRK